MTRLLLPLFVLFALTTACGVPSEDDLQGVWVNLDFGSLKAYEFTQVETSPIMNTYDLYEYPSGADPILVESGTYRTERATVSGGSKAPALVTVADSGGQTVNEILEFEQAFIIVLEDPGGPNGQRSYNWTEQLP